MALQNHTAFDPLFFILMYKIENSYSLIIALYKILYHMLGSQREKCQNFYVQRDCVTLKENKIKYLQCSVTDIIQR